MQAKQTAPLSLWFTMHKGRGAEICAFPPIHPPPKSGVLLLQWDSWGSELDMCSCGVRVAFPSPCLLLPTSISLAPENATQRFGGLCWNGKSCGPRNGGRKLSRGAFHERALQFPEDRTWSQPSVWIFKALQNNSIPIQGTALA